jgi:glycosyltransferase involved in cell wall biosynthesis
MGQYVLFNSLPAWRGVRAFKPDLLHVHFALPTGVVGYWVHRLTGVRYVLTAHLGDVPGGVPEQTDRLFRCLGPLPRPIWRRAARRVAVSTWVRDLAIEAYGQPVSVIPNGVRLGGTRPAPTGPHDPPRLLFAGRFSVQKNLPFLVRALGRIRDEGWELEMLGDGPERPAVEAAIREHGLADRVTLRGWQSTDAVEDAMDRSDILVLPSRSEGFPVVAVQALAHGLAIAASTVGGLRDLVEDGVNGVTAPPDDEKACAAALRRLFSDPEKLLSMQTASRERASAFDIRQSAAQYERIFKEVVAQS